jgi:SAM-dependent methyltransferase
MSGDYRDYGYTVSSPGEGDVGRDLAELFVGYVRRLDGATHVCELGCGNGYLASRLGASGLHLTGIDASESGIEIARRHYATDKVSFLRAEIGADLKALLPAGERFDVVVSSEVIEHLYRPAALIEAAAALLKPGGYLIVGTPYHGYLKNLALSILDRWDAHHAVHWDGGHIKFFSVETLRDLVSRHGFAETKFSFYGRMPWLWKSMICTARLAPPAK